MGKRRFALLSLVKTLEDNCFDRYLTNSSKTNTNKASRISTTWGKKFFFKEKEKEKLLGHWQGQGKWCQGKKTSEAEGGFLCLGRQMREHFLRGHLSSDPEVEKHQLS